MTTATLLVTLSQAFIVPFRPSTLHSFTSTRGDGSSVVMQGLKQTNRPQSTDLALWWKETPSGYKYIDDTIGAGIVPAPSKVVQLHYTVTLLSSGTTLGTSRDGQPLTLAVGKHNVPIWDEALTDMRIGGKRRLLVPPSALPDFQAGYVPGESRTLRFDFELLHALDHRHPMALFASLVPPHERQIGRTARQIFVTMYLLSFVPYFLPYSMQPSGYHDGVPVAERRARQQQRLNSRFIGGDMHALDQLFPK